MNDERLLGALRRYGDMRVLPAADRAVRLRLEETRAHPSAPRMPWTARLMPVPLTLLLTLALGGASLGAGADSPLWDARVALEDLGALARVSADARAAYLQELVESRTAEMARLEAVGNAAGAGRARGARERTLQSLGILPIPDPAPVPSAQPALLPAGLPTPTPTPGPSEMPELSPPVTRPAAATTGTPLRATLVLVRSPSPAPKATPTKPPLGTATPKPTATPPVKQPIFVSGKVVFADGTNVTGACITTGPSIAGSTSCITRSSGGGWGFVADLVPGTTVTLYATTTDAVRGTVSSFASSVRTAPMTEFGTIVLKPQ